MRDGLVAVGRIVARCSAQSVAPMQESPCQTRLDMRQVAGCNRSKRVRSPLANLLTSRTPPAPIPNNDPYMDYASWSDWLAAALVIVFGLVGVVLTVVTLPGLWLTLLVAGGMWWWKPGFFNWWTFGLCIGLAVIAEVIELVAGTAGASKAGASRTGSIVAGIGSLIGAIVCAPFFFPIGSIAGGVLGAAAGAIAIERGLKKKTWEQATQAGQGAAIGRIIATAAKVSLAVVIAVILSVGVFVP